MSKKRQKFSIDTKHTPIYSNARNNLFITWFIAVVLSAFSYPIIDVGFERAEGGENILLGGIVFLALFFVYSATKITINWFYFGRTPLFMDPSVGSIGGQVGGSIILNHRYDDKNRFKVTLSNHYTYTTTSTRNGKREQTRHTETLWEEEGYGVTHTKDSQTALQFCFNVPKSTEATHDMGQKGYYWIITITLEEFRYAFTREFEIPVKSGKRKSTNLHMKPLNVRGESATEAMALSAIILEEDEDQTTITSPEFHLGDIAAGFGIFGGMFAVIGFSILVFSDELVSFFVGSVLSMIGSAIILRGLYEYVVAREVVIDEDRILEIGTLFGFPLFKNTISRHKPFSIKTVGWFNEAIKKNRKESFSHIVMEQDGQMLYLARYVESISKQKEIKKFFYIKLKREKN